MGVKLGDNIHEATKCGHVGMMVMMGVKLGDNGPHE